MLVTHLKSAGLITGALLRNTSHSRMGVTKKWLLGQPQFKEMPGSEIYLNFGSAFHERALVNSFARKVQAEQERHLKGMLTNYQKHPIVKRLMSKAVYEIKKYCKLNGVEISFILDIHQISARVGSDIKTTACNTLADFVEKAFQYGYATQGVTYMKAVNLKDFYFIGVQKDPPYNIFILRLGDHPDELAYAEKELEFLLYFYKHYGNPII